ncbi:MAG: hypothetical protein KKI09_06595 [Spirochaetes bacterium]|nr:hypothetical protein [Spirochaetota bacterium]
MKRLWTGFFLCILLLGCPLIIVAETITDPALRVWIDIVLSEEYPAVTSTWMPFPVRAFVDETSKSYRTGQIDPAIAEIPAELSSLLTTNPAAGIRALAGFLRNDGGSAGRVANQFHYAKRVHDLITATVAYDSDAFSGNKVLPTSDDPLVYLNYASGPRATCGGFARLFGMFMEVAGIEALIIDGFSRNYLRLPGNTTAWHQWNAVKIGGRWYIVDTTGDSRLSFYNNSMTPIKSYRDGDLFIAPELKLVENMAYDPAEQLVAEPISKVVFLSLPKITAQVYIHGVELFSPDQLAGLSKYEEDYSAALKYRADSYDSKSGIKTFQFIVPKEFSLGAWLYDENDKIVYYRTLVTAEAYSATHNKVTILFSAPERGRHWCKISVKDLSAANSSYKALYSFYVNETAAGADYLPANKLELATDLASLRYGVSFSPVRVNSADPDFYTFGVSYPAGTQVAMSVYSASGVRQDDFMHYTMTGLLAKQYNIGTPPPGEYFVEVKAKTSEAASFNDIVGIWRFTSSGEGPRRYPRQTLHYYTSTTFYDKGFSTVTHNLETVAAGGVYEVCIRDSLGEGMKCLLKDKDGKNVEGHYSTTLEGDIYTFRFSAPSEPGEYTARIYRYTGSSFTTACFFIINSTVAGPELVNTW